MDIPSKIKIGGHEIKIVEIIDLDNLDNVGRWVKTKNEIQIEKNQSQSQKESTLLHEIIEAINDLYELDLNKDYHKITTLETALYQVLKDNNFI